MNSRRRVPQMEDVKVTRMINGPEGFTPDNEFCLGETEVPGLFVAGGFCAHGLAGAGGVGKVMAEWIASGEPSMDLWQMDVRRFGGPVPLALVHARARARDLRDLLRHPLPLRGAPGRPAAAHLPGVRMAPRARCGLRREVGLGARELVRVERGRRRRVAAPARLGGQALVAGHRRRARGVPRGRGDLRRVVVRQARDGRARARPRLLERLCDNEVARDVGQRDLHADAQLARRHRVRLHGGPRSPRSASRSSPAPRSATTTASGSAATSPTTARTRSRRHVRLGVLRHLGARARARRSASLTPQSLVERGVSVHER